jgi:hypothetical protein
MSKTNVMVDTLRRIAPAIGLVGAAFFLPGCYAGVDEDVAYYPSAGFIATEQPVFYDGHASYWYNGHWVYRDAGGRWGYYRSEPAFLAQRRAGPGPGFARRTYERPAAPRPAPPRR